MLVDDEARKQLTLFVANELSAVEDQDGQIRSLVKTEGQSSRAVVLVPNPTSTFLVQHANGDVQTITTKGLVIKAAKDWLAPTLTMIAVERAEA